MRRNWTMIAVAAVVLAACQSKDVFDADWQRDVGVVDPALSSVQMISAPTQANVNTAFTVTVRTLGSSSCTRVAETEVAVSGLNVDITPYDEYTRSVPVCTTDLRAFEHQARVTVGTAGEARIRLHARTLAGAAFTHDVPVTIRP